MRLTDKAVAALTLPGGKRDVIFFDEALIGFGYRLRQGADSRLLRSWIVQYRAGGRHRKARIGAGEVLGAEQARAAAKKILAAVALGGDPQAERGERRGRDRLSFRRIVDDFLAGKAESVRPKSLSTLRLYLTGAYFRPLHGLPIDKVTRRDIAARLVVIERDNGAPTALKARASLSAFFVWAMRSGLADGNPAIETPAPAIGRGRERVLSDAELAAVWRHAGDDDFGRITRLLILLGCRRAEIGGMCWSEIDVERGIWTLPAARSKNSRPHSLPIMPMMAAIIDQVPRRATRDALFGDRSAAGFAAWHQHKASIDARSGVTEWQLRDIRRSVATGMGNLNIAPHVIEQILNHQSGHRRGVAGIYNKSLYEREVKAALGVWHDHVRAIVAGTDPIIVPFQKTSDAAP
jgi:integrase